MDEVMQHHPPTTATNPPPGMKAAAAGALRKNGAPGKPLRILLVEDSPLLRGRLENMLSQHAAFKVTGLAAAEAEAIEKLDSVPYDVIVVDVELRPGSGIGVIRQARQRRRSDDRTERLPVEPVPVATAHDVQTAQSGQVRRGE